MIKVLDQMGEEHTITEKLWESLSSMPKCKFRLAEIPIPKEVVEFKPTKAKQLTEVDEFIEKKCCKEADCDKNIGLIGNEAQQKIAVDEKINETKTVAPKKPAKKSGRKKK